MKDKKKDKDELLSLSKTTLKKLRESKIWNDLTEFVPLPLLPMVAVTFAIPLIPMVAVAIPPMLAITVMIPLTTVIIIVITIGVSGSVSTSVLTMALP